MQFVGVGGIATILRSEQRVIPIQGAVKVVLFA